MLRGENVGCGTSTTGTGTLTLAATPAAVGAIDPFIWLTEKFSSSDRPVHLIPYVLIEYADSTYAKPTKFERGIGTITLSTSLAATTLARTTILATQAIGTPNYITTSPTAFSIGTAANVLLFLGPGAYDAIQCSPYYDSTTTGTDAKGASPVQAGNAALGTGLSLGIAQGLFFYFLFPWAVPMLVKRATIRASTGDAGATDVYVSLYEVGTDGRPGRLLLDLGELGTAGQSLRNTGFVSTALHANGIFLPPGQYFFTLSFVTITNTPVLNTLATPVYLGGQFQATGRNSPIASASGANATAPDPATLTGLAIFGNVVPAFWLNNV